MKLVLDTDVLGRVCHPRRHADVKAWLVRVASQHEVLISEVADYELRRELIRIGSRRSIARLDELARELVYVPVTTSTWRVAARLWAVSRSRGQPGAAPDAMDGDVLIAAQAIAEGATVVTRNVRHFAHLVASLEWSLVPLGPAPAG